MMIPMTGTFIEVQNQVVGRTVLFLGTLGVDPPFPLLSSFWWLPAILGILWLIDASFQALT